METAKLFQEEEINIQLQRILNSPGFTNSPTLSRFLSFIVLETALGKQDQIKEYSIAVNVLHRPTDFKPQDDAIVRIHAGRLRRALTEYYLIQGINDPIIIHIPKGAYIPQFKVGIESTTQIKLPISAEQHCRPVFAIFPFRATPKSPEIENFSSLLGEQLSAELTRLHVGAVIGYYSKEMTETIKRNILEGGRASGANYIITGSLQYHDQTIKAMIILLSVTTGEIITGEIFEKQIAVRDLYKIQDEIVHTMINNVNKCNALRSRKTANEKISAYTVRETQKTR